MSKINLPVGWHLTSLGNVVQVIRGVTYNKNQSSSVKTNNYLPVLRANNIQSGVLELNDLVYVDASLISEKQKIKVNDVIVAMSSGSKSVVGKTARALKDLDAGFGAFCGILRPLDSIHAPIVSLFTSTAYYRSTVSELSAGANINNLKPSHFDEIFFPLAPLAEQKVIAEKLDEMLGKVDRIKTRLERILQILKQFRQSVLSDAVSGKLTEEWRKQSNVPAGSFVRLKDVLEVNPKKERYQDDLDVGFVPMSKINEGTDYKVKFEPEKWGEVKTGYTSFKNNDVLLAKITPCFENGKSAIVTDLPNGVGAGSTEYIVLRSQENKVLPGLIAFNISTEAFLSEGALSMTGSVGHKRVPKEFVENWSIYLPREEEQKMICMLVKHAFDYAKKVESETINALKKIELLSPSILAKAFKGELTEKWRKENPELISGENSAEALLAEIKVVERAKK